MAAAAHSFHSHKKIRWFGPTPPPPWLWETVVRQAVPMAPGQSLAAQWRASYDAMVNFLAQLGHRPGPLRSLPRRQCNEDDERPGKPGREHSGYGLSRCDVDRLRSDARITYLRGRIDPAEVIRPELRGRDVWPAGASSQSHTVAVSGSIRILVDDNGARAVVPPTSSSCGGSSVLCVSIAAINFAYDAEDLRRYSTADDNGATVNDEGRRCMRNLWHHTLRCCSEARRDVAVLCAMGCGAFAGGIRDVPYAYATTLAHVLAAKDYGLSGVVVCLPGRDGTNYRAFERAFAEQRQPPLRTPVVLTGLHGTLNVTLALMQQEGPRGGGCWVGMNNPSDPEAIRTGSIGMYWNKGNIAFEEVLAVKTTLLLHHIDVNPWLWDQDPGPIPAFEDNGDADGPSSVN